jgi:hypothetical protein
MRMQGHSRIGMPARRRTLHHPKLPGHPAALLCLALTLLGTATGCDPSVSVGGVYFPGWLVSVIAGVVSAYGIVIALSHRPQTKELADSGLLFLGLVVGIALLVWWIFFSDF